MSNLFKGNRAGLIKTAAILTAVSTVLSLSAIMSLSAFAVAPGDYGLKEGNTISAAGSSDPDVYIVNDWGYKRLFLNPAIFNLYGHLGGFAAVKNVSATTRDAFGTSGLFRVDGTQKVYGIESTGEDVAVLHWVNTSGAQAVADDANFFKKVFVINQAEFNLYSVGSNYTSVNQVPSYARVPGQLPSGPISASLASSNPVSGTIVNGQARYDLAEFMFSGSGTVTSVKLNRIGVSADATLTNVYLYDGAKRLTDSATVSSGLISFNDAGGLFTVSGSKVISVLADVSGSAGETIGVQLTGVNSATYSISGNIHTLATATLATTALSTSVTPSSDGGPAPANDFVAWNDAVTIGTRYVWLKSVQYRVVGSIAAGDLQNFRLLVDGVQQGSAVAQQDAGGYIVFDMSASPVKLETGSRTFKVLVDIIGGSSKNFYLSLRQKSDIWTVDSQYNGSSVLATGTFPVSSTAQIVAPGTLTITTKTDSPSGDVVKGASGALLGRFEFKAAGERMKIESLRLSFTGDTTIDGDSLRNGALFADGIQIGSTKDLFEETASGSVNTLGYTEYTLGSSLIVAPGTPRIVEIRADIFDNSAGNNDITTAGTIIANIVAGSSNVQRLTTLDYPATAQLAKSGNQLTIRTGALTGGKYTGYANQSIVSPKNGVKLGHYTLTAASSEDVNVNTITFDSGKQTAGSGANGTLTSDFTDTYVKIWNDAGSVILTSPTKATFSDTASTSFSTNFVLPKSKTYQIELWANAASSFASTDIIATNMDASGVTVGSSTTATAAQVSGQTVSGASGQLVKANGAIPASRFINGGQTASTYSFTLTPTYDDFTIDELYVDIATPAVASNSGAIANLYLKNTSGTVIGTTTLISTTGSASFTGLNLSLLQSGGTQTYTVDVAFSSVGVGANDTGGSVTMLLDGLKYRNSGGTVTTTTGLATTYTGNAFYDVKGYPTFTNAALPTTVLSPGTFQTLFKTVLSATGNQISWNDITFIVASNSVAGTFGPADTNWKLYENGTDITTFSGSNKASVSDVSSTTRVEFTFATERAVSVGNPVTLELKTTSGGTIASNEYVTTQITNPTTTTVTTDDSTSQRSKPATFVWSDQSAPLHATTTDDWFSDGMLVGLIQAQTLTK